MSRHGWQHTELPRDRTLAMSEAARARSLVFTRGNNATMVLAFEHAEGSTSMMSLLAQ